MKFDVSVDNLALPDYDPSPFRDAVLNRVNELIENGLPDRVSLFAQALFARHYQSSESLVIPHLRECYENYCR